MQDPEQAHSIETRIDAGVLHVRFDGGHWLPLINSVKKVLTVEDLGGPPRAGRVTYLTDWGVQKTDDFTLRTPRRLG